MASIRKRSWTTASGERREGWQVDFVDQAGKRQRKQFTKRKDADNWLVDARGEVKRGTYTPDSTSATIAEAIDLWIERAEAERLERSTIEQYKQQQAHLLAAIDGRTKLSRLSKDRCEQLRNQVVKDHSRTMARKILQSFRSVVRGRVAQDVAAAATLARAKRHKRRLEVGVDVPAPGEVNAMIDAAADDPKACAFVCLAGLAGLRASEIRGLPWSDVDLGTSPSVTVSQRADRWSKIGSPKSDDSKRTVPLGTVTVRAIKAWKLAQPPLVTKENGKEIRRPRTLVFGTANDRPDMLGNLTRRLLDPLEVAAGVTSGPKLDQDGKPVLDKKRKPVMLAKYSPHALRHYAVSSWLKTCNGDFKRAQSWAGHATLTLTLDTYGHLIPRDNDQDVIAAAEALLGT